MKTTSVKELSIQNSLNGLSFCIINKGTNEVEFLKSESFNSKQTPQNLLEKLKTVLETNSVFEQTFENVLCIYQNELSCLVPSKYFNETNLADYLKFNAKILKTDFISQDKVEAVDAYNVFVPLVNINNYIFEMFGTFTFKHSSTILIENLSHFNVSESDRIFVNINNTSFEFLCFKDSQLQLYNTFQYYTPEDFIYYLLFTVEQLELNPETIKLYLLGKIETENKLYELIYKYIRFVELLDFKSRYNFSPDYKIEKHSDYFLILNSFE